MSYYDDASLVLIPSGVKTSKVYSQKPTNGDGDLTFTRASTATRINASGLIESVASNVPRLDYRNADGTLSTCGRLLLEPQRTNIVLYSEQINNAAWSNTEDTTVSANVGTSPDGNLNADKLIPQATSQFHRVVQTFSVTASTPYTFSVFVKRDGYDYFLIRTSDAVNDNVGYDLLNGTVTFQGSGYAGFIQSYGNDWYRIGYVRSFTGTSAFIFLRPNPTIVNSSTIATFTGNGTSGALVWGAQLELGAYATTYIPTTTAAVTRIADAASKTGVSSLIGQTEGTLYAEFIPTSNLNVDVIQLQATTALDNVVSIGCGSGSIYGVVYANGGYRFQPVISRTIPGERFKVALCYKSNDFTFFINGVKVASGANNYTPLAPLTRIAINETLLFGKQTINYSNALIIPNKLSDAAAIQLTTL